MQKCSVKISFCPLCGKELQLTVYSFTDAYHCSKCKKYFFILDRLNKDDRWGITVANKLATIHHHNEVVPQRQEVNPTLIRYLDGD